MIGAVDGAQVCDLGLARTDEVLQSATDCSSAVNPRWLSPEVLVGGAHSPASDVYAFGIVMCALRARSLRCLIMA